MIHMMCLQTDSSVILIFQIAGQCFIYEPLFSQDEVETVKELGCSLIQSNEVQIFTERCLGVIKFSARPRNNMCWFPVIIIV